MRVGLGYDVHQFAADRRLVLGGVEIPHPLGLLGYSDADVALHALTDAILGAAALGDLGEHFPTGDPRYRDMSSIEFLRQALEMIAERSFEVINADLTIVAQTPRLSPYVMPMREAIASALEVEVGQVSVKATTTDHLGFVGRKEGIAVLAVVLLGQVEQVGV